MLIRPLPWYRLSYRLDVLSFADLPAAFLVEVQMQNHDHGQRVCRPQAALGAGTTTVTTAVCFTPATAALRPCFIHPQHDCFRFSCWRSCEVRFLQTFHMSGFCGSDPATFLHWRERGSLEPLRQEHHERHSKETYRTASSQGQCHKSGMTRLHASFHRCFAHNRQSSRRSSFV